jgi:hypothetical protein
MIKSFFAVEDQEIEEKTGIDWLDTAIALALHLVIETMKEYKEVKEDRRLAEFGNAAVLKTDDT